MLNWKQSPEIMQARRVAKELGASRIIILMIDDKAGTIGYASYGADSRLCEEAGRLAEVAYKAVYQQMVIDGK
jgi:hypothetical protein